MIHVGDKTLKEIEEIIKKSKTWQLILDSPAGEKLDYYNMHAARRWIQYGRQRYDYWVSDWVQEWASPNLTVEELTNYVVLCEKLKRETDTDIRRTMMFASDLKELPSFF